MSGFFGKTADTVDFGGEADYAAYEWFKEPPPHRPPPQSSEPYIPQQVVIEQNDMLDYALKAAPNVVFGRFKQYGQLGVLAWCAEFDEMITAIKHLGLEGNMFVSTRAAALGACKEILNLDMIAHIKMQIIVIHLTSMIARLRRFLDPDPQKLYEDYPPIDFPVDPSVYEHK